LETSPSELQILSFLIATPHAEHSSEIAVFHPSGLCANTTFSFDAEVPAQSRTISISRTDTELC
jgi:hypothetical protein